MAHPSLQAFTASVQQVMAGLDPEGQVRLGRAIRFLLAHLDDGVTAMYLPHLQHLAAIAQRHGRRRALYAATRQHAVN
jgi:hypothetical protein